MEELIKIQQDSEGNNLVSARELYDFLEVKTEFSKWCTRMFEYGFEEGRDFSLVKIGERYAHNKTDYALMIDTAKEIAMLQRTDKGKQARQYFIECEKLAKSTLHQQPQAPQLPQTYIEALEELVKAEKEKLLLQQTNSNLKTALDTLNDWSSILRVAKHNNVNENIFEWRKLKNASRKLGYEVKKAPSPRYNYQNLYHLDAFRLVYPQFNYDLPDFVD
jgi:phage anti-repressor protein